MSEYMIRTHEGEWPAVHRDRMAAVLVPEGSAYQPVNGWGDFRMASGGTVVAFSGEMSGWQVIVGGDLDDEVADALVERITRQVSAEVGQPCEWIRYG
jgi:hypothetical protein